MRHCDRAHITPPTERPTVMPPAKTYLHLLSRPLGPLLSLVLLAGLISCGPATPDNAPNIESRASQSGAPLSKQNSALGTNPSTPITPATSPIPLVPRDERGVVTGKGTLPAGNSPQAISVSAAKPPEVLDPLVVPEWIAKDLESPDIGTRLRALDTWAQSAPPGAEDPLIMALANKDERVRSRAMELIEQNWARAADAEQ